MIWAIVAAVVVLLVAGAGAAVGDREHITRMYVAATLDPSSGHLEVTEEIDYDFGVAPRHGIYREVPDVVADAQITVTSETAPDQILVTGAGSRTRIRVGDPNRTITGLHRYELFFVLDGDAVVDEPGRELEWAAVGTEWTVDIDEADIVLAVPFELADVACGQTGTFTPSDCTIEHLGPGIVRVGIESLSPGTGLTIVAGLGTPRSDVDPATVVVNDELDDPGTGLIPPALLAGLAALLGAVPAAIIVRRAGREKVWLGGAADAAHGPRDQSQYERITEAELGELTSIEFESPRGMSAVEGGILIEERVLDRHQTAWLLECAIRDEVELDGADSDRVSLHVGKAPAHPHSAQILDRMFAGRDRISLESHDPSFQSGWTRLKAELNGWRRDSDHWDPAHRKAHGLAVGGGSVLVVLGLIITFVGGWQANRWGSFLWLTVIGGVVAGFGAAAAIRSWELHVRTPKGSARWLQIESFRRFLHESEAHHVEYAAERGLLRQYTAWAVALDETDAWSIAVAAAVAANPAMRSTMGDHLLFATAASSFSNATRVASTKPSSSGSGGGGFGGGGGGFGGGGGGGGGSW